MSMKNETIIKPKKKIFVGINFILAPLIFGIVLIGLLIDYYKNGKVYPTEKIIIISIFTGLVILFLNFAFSRYKLSFSEKDINYQNFLSRKKIEIDQIDFARYEYGYKDTSEKNIPISRFVIYSKPNTNQSPLVINLNSLDSIEKLVAKLDEINKLKTEKDYTK